MKEKNGFTLVELMAVIVVLAIIISIGTVSVVSTIAKSKAKSADKMRAELLDTAVAYGLSSFHLSACPLTGTQDESTIQSILSNPTSSYATSHENCYRIIKASTLLDVEKLYRDDAKHCNRSQDILIYKYKSPSDTSDGYEIEEYRAYAADDICAN